MYRLWLVALGGMAIAIACGRTNFDPLSGDGGAGTIDAGARKDGIVIVDAAFFDAPGTMGIDAPKPIDGSVAACANFELGSALGKNLVTGNTAGQGDHYSACSGAGSPDVSYAWTAPSSGKFTIDVCSGPDQSFDSTLTILNGSCTGSRLACNDDGCGNFLSAATVSLTAGETIIIVVDGDFDAGKFALSIQAGMMTSKGVPAGID